MAASSHVHEWARQVQIVSEGTYGTDPTTGYVKVALEARPTMDPGRQLPLDTGSVGVGLAQDRAAELTEGLRLPKITGWKHRYDEVLLGKYLSRLFQSIPSATGTYTYDWNVYTAQASTALGLSLRGTVEAGTSGEGEIVTGGVVTALKISGADNGQPIMLEPTFAARAWAPGTVASVATFTAPALRAMFWNVVCTIVSTATNIFAFELNLNTNMTGLTYNNQTVQDWPLGKWQDTGSITITSKSAFAGQYAIYLAGTAQKLKLEIGTAAANGYFKWERDVVWLQPTFGKTPGGVETMTLPFKTALQSSPTTSLVELVVAAAIT